MKYFVTVCSMVLSLALLASDIHAQSSSSLHARLDDTANVINVYRAGDDTPILTQNARDDFRPYIHPIVAPDGNGILTEYSPGHHKHQTGLYWGFTRVNGRDYFHHPEGDYWRKVSAKVLKAEAAGPLDSVQWQTVYDQLDENGDAILRRHLHEQQPCVRPQRPVISRHCHRHRRGQQLGGRQLHRDRRHRHGCARQYHKP